MTRLEPLSADISWSWHSWLCPCTCSRCSLAFQHVTNIHCFCICISYYCDTGVFTIVMKITYSTSSTLLISIQSLRGTRSSSTVTLSLRANFPPSKIINRWFHYRLLHSTFEMDFPIHFDHPIMYSLLIYLIFHFPFRHSNPHHSHLTLSLQP